MIKASGSLFLASVISQSQSVMQITIIEPNAIRV